MKKDSTKKKKKIIRDYNSSYPIYDSRYQELQYKKFRSALEKVSLANKIILDAGCGTGLLYEYIEENSKSIIQNHFFSLVGVDISIEMIKKFREKVSLKISSTKKKIHLILADLENLPFRPDTFTCIFSFTSFQNLPNLKKGLKESIRVANPQASFKVTILKKKLDEKKFLKTLEDSFQKVLLLDDQEDSLEDLIIKAYLIKK